MSKDGRNLKLACIACLFAGLATLVIGVAVGVTSVFDTDAIATIACGVGGLPAGGQASRLANVPAHAGRIRSISLVMLAASGALLAVSMALGDPTTLQLVALTLVAAIALAMAVFAHRVVRGLERV